MMRRPLALLATVFLGSFVLSMSAANSEEAEKEPLTDAERIARHRMGDLIIKTSPGASISVEQQAHEFWFGTAISRNAWNGEMSDADREKYLQVLKENFNAAVPENAGKWGGCEPKPGQYNYETLDEMFEWCHENGLRTRGHCVYWTVPKRVKGWLKRLDNELLYAKTRVRAFDVMNRYKGSVNEWDMNNEMLHGDFFESRLGSNIRDLMFRWCKEANPDAILYLNDYSILNGKQVDNYVKQIKHFQGLGTPIGGIGVQGHFWTPFVPVEKVRESFAKLAELGLPIKVTEFDFGHDDPEKQAEGFEQLYTIAFAEPMVNGIFMWGFWEGRHWRPDDAPWKKDWTLTPAAETYRRLVFDEWWTRWQGEANDSGEAELRAFYGTYEVTVDGETREVQLAKETGSATVDFTVSKRTSDSD